MTAPAIYLNYKPFDPSKAHIRLKEVCEITFRGRSWVYSQMRNGTFPHPVQLSPAVVVWRREDVEAYMIESIKTNGSGVAEVSK
ncbi:TPA: AlpA family phage regulatory protein [Enterobacter roggenkampii]|nr:AlpA family phage regulatory protein [Enterobacter roggenkampii]